MLKNRNNFRDNLSGFCSLTVTAFLLLFMLFLLVSSFLGTTLVETGGGEGEIVVFADDNFFLNTIIAAISVALAYLLYSALKNVPLKFMRLALAVWTFALGTLFVCSARLQPVQDAYIVTFFAEQTAKGNYSYYNEYFTFFPFQLGFVLYEELFFRLFNFLLPGLPEGFAYLSLQLLNVVYVAIAFYAVSGISSCLFKRESVRKTTLILLFFCPQPIFFSTFMYGNIPAFAFSAVGVWLFLLHIKEEKPLYGIACSVSIALAVLLKLNSLIVVVAVSIVWMICLVKKPKLKSLICLLFMIAAVLAINPLPQKLYDARIGRSLGSGIPQFSWMAMGLHEGLSCAGWYDPTYTTTAFESFEHDAEKTSAFAKAAILERLEYFRKEPVEALEFFQRKLTSQWNEPTCQSLWINMSRKSFSSSGKLFDIISHDFARQMENYMNFFQQLVYFGFVLGLIKLLWHRDILKTLLPLIILGGILYHLLFEAKAQYALSYFILMIPTAAYGLSLFTGLADRKRGEEHVPPVST